VFIPLFVVPFFSYTAYLHFQMPETRGREIHEIVQELKDRS
jgi:hypothetical protein